MYPVRIPDNSLSTPCALGFLVNVQIFEQLTGALQVRSRFHTA